MEDDPDAHEAGRRLAGLIGLVFGALMHVIVGTFVLSTVLVAPTWLALPLVVAWVAGGWVLWRLRRAPLLALLVPFGTAAAWWAAVSAARDHLG